MCGISGCTTFGMTKEDIVSVASNFMDALSHRGPDGRGYVVENQGLLLCHNRLAIQDLSLAGAQPMVSYTSRFVISYNGEIYNFRDLREQCVRLGVSFRGHSDTEVLLACVELWGLEATLSKCNGMFAFALYDREARSLSLARDRLGEKPLFYGYVDKQFFFTSELKVIRALEGKLDLNVEAISEFLAYGYVPTPLSIFKGIKKLPAGNWISFSIQEMQETIFLQKKSTTYWSVTDAYSNKGIITDPRAVSHSLEGLLSASIERQLVADVPVGSLLSGGIDSTLVTAIAQRVANRPIKTFTIGFDALEYDESTFAKEIAFYLGTEHVEITLSGADTLSVLETLPEVYDEPFADPSQIPSLLVAKAAKQHVSVCLSGDGGDELFCGYNRYTSAQKLWKLSQDIPYPIRKMLSTICRSINPDFLNAFYQHYLTLRKLQARKQANIGGKLLKVATLLLKNERANVYDQLLHLSGSAGVLNANREHIILERVSKIFGDETANFLDCAMKMDQENYLCDDNLHKVDRASMRSSLEIRLPLLDKELVEFSWCVPASIKCLDSKGKWPLRDVLSRYVPRSLTDRPKMGFSVPLAKWLRNDLKDWSWDMLQGSELKNYIDVEFYSQLWSEHQSHKFDHSLELWPALMFAHWWKSWADKIAR